MSIPEPAGTRENRSAKDTVLVVDFTQSEASTTLQSLTQRLPERGRQAASTVLTLRPKDHNKASPEHLHRQSQRDLNFLYGGGINAKRNKTSPNKSGAFKETC